MPEKSGFEGELEALGAVFAALEPLGDEGRRFVLEAVASRLGLGLPGPPPGPRPGAGDPEADAPGPGPGGAESPKDFLREKHPASDVQRVACLAYYLTHMRDQAHFKSRDLVELNREAALPPINMSRAVANATAQNGYLVVAGQGNKQISALGEDVVKALPDRDAAREVEAAKRPKPKRKKGARKKSVA